MRSVGFKSTNQKPKGRTLFLSLSDTPCGQEMLQDIIGGFLIRPRSSIITDTENKSYAIISPLNTSEMTFLHARNDDSAAYKCVHVTAV